MMHQELETIILFLYYQEYGPGPGGETMEERRLREQRELEERERKLREIEEMRNRKVKILLSDKFIEFMS